MRKNISFVLIFFYITHLTPIYKLYGKPAKDSARCLVGPRLASSFLPGHKSLDEDVNEYLFFRSAEAPFYLNLVPVVLFF